MRVLFSLIYVQTAILCIENILENRIYSALMKSICGTSHR